MIDREVYNSIGVPLNILDFTRVSRLNAVDLIRNESISIMAKSAAIIDFIAAVAIEDRINTKYGYDNTYGYRTSITDDNIYIIRFTELIEERIYWMDVLEAFLNNYKYDFNLIIAAFVNTFNLHQYASNSTPFFFPKHLSINYIIQLIHGQKDADTFTTLTSLKPELDLRTADFWQEYETLCKANKEELENLDLTDIEL